MRATIQHYSSTKISHIIVVMLYSEEMEVKTVNNEGINELTMTVGLLDDPAILRGRGSDYTMLVA
jgi:hypothetical protein